MEHLKNKNYEISILYLNKAINQNSKNPILFEKSKKTFKFQEPRIIFNWDYIRSLWMML